MEKLLDVISVEPHKNDTLLLVFENQEKRLFDMTPYLARISHQLSTATASLAALAPFCSIGVLDIPPRACLRAPASHALQSQPITPFRYDIR